MTSAQIITIIIICVPLLNIRLATSDIRLLYANDFTYIDDIVTGIFNIISSEGKPTKENYKIYNIGNHESVELGRFVKAIEDATGKKAIIEYKPMQSGDVFATYADITEIQKDYNFKPVTIIEEGIRKFVDWYRVYHTIKN